VSDGSQKKMFRIKIEYKTTDTTIGSIYIYVYLYKWYITYTYLWRATRKLYEFCVTFYFVG